MKKSTGCALLGTLVLGAVGALIYTARTPPNIGGVPLKELPPEQQAQRRQEAKQLETQLDEVARAGRNRERKPFELRISSDQVNTLLQDRLDTSKFPLKNLRVGFVPDGVQAQGEVSLQGLSGVATLTGNVAAQNGQLQFQTEKLQIGGLPAPGDWKEKVDREVTEKLNSALKNAPGRIDKVELQQDVMIVSGQTN